MRSDPARVRLVRHVLVMVLTVVFASGIVGLVPGGAAEASREGARSVGRASQTPPSWCQWIPDPWKPPECTTAPPTSEPPAGGASVGAHFRAAGPWAVTSQTVNVPGVGNTGLYYPTDLGADGYDHPIVAFGIGAFQSNLQYSDTLQHLASWGYVVVSPDNGQVTPELVLDATEWTVAQDTTSSSVFFDDLDTTRVGALGHSRGSWAASVATLMSDGLITSTVPISAPDRIWGTDEEIHFYEFTTPIFFVTGAADFLTTPGEQTYYYDQVPGAAAKAALVGGDHFAIQQTDNAMQGYITAWLKYSLEGDQFARGAFVGSPAELSGDSAWTQQALKALS